MHGVRKDPIHLTASSEDLAPQDAMQDEGFQLSAIIHDSAVTLVDVGDVGVGTVITHLWQPQGLPDPDMIAGKGVHGWGTFEICI